MKYAEFLEEIFAKSATNRKLELSRITNFLNAIGNPQNSLKGIHIAGTNGKGSTAAAIESILFAHDFNVGLNTSPHLVDYAERFRINKKIHSKMVIKKFYEDYKDLHEKCTTSYFEISTSIAFQLFAQEKVDYAIMEVGLGGRLDASVLVNPVITAITNIDYDHTKTLGNTLPKIATEKAGILKDKIPIVIGKMRPSPKKIIKKIAFQKNCSILDLEKEVIISNLKLFETGSLYRIEIPKFDIDFDNVFCNLVGIHQVFNSAQAILIATYLANKFDWKLKENKVKNGLSSVIWEGRMQKIEENPTIIIDGAHNPDGIKTLVYNLQNIYKYKRIIFVIGIFSDKDFNTMVKNLSSIADMFIISKSKSRRAIEMDTLAKVVEKYTKNYLLEEDMIKALERAKKIALKDDFICVTGSLYTIGEILKAYKN